MIQKLSHFLYILFFLLQSCGSKTSKEPIKIGVDPTWYPVDFGAQTSYVLGFTEELLLEISQESKLQFEWITANSDSLYEKMREEEYRAVLGSLQSYDFNAKLYSSSEDFLQIGPVLIVPKTEKVGSLKEMQGKLIGTIDGQRTALLLIPYPSIVSRPNYHSISELLTAVSNGEIDGALLDCIPAVQYVSDLFQKELKIATAPLTKAGLRLIAMEKDPVVAQFNAALTQLKKNKKWDKLLVKWGLAVAPE